MKYLHFWHPRDALSPSEPVVSFETVSGKMSQYHRFGTYHSHLGSHWMELVSAGLHLVHVTGGCPLPVWPEFPQNKENKLNKLSIC